MQAATDVMGGERVGAHRQYIVELRIPNLSLKEGGETWDENIDRFGTGATAEIFWRENVDAPSLCREHGRGGRTLGML